MADHRKLYGNLKREWQSLIDFLQVELGDQSQMILSDLMPFSQNLLTQALAACHEKLSALHNEVELRRDEILKLNEVVENEKARLQMMTEEKLRVEA
jgi:hypothetical protein